MRIGIVGCGTAGPAAACLLARQGHEVVVFERAPGLRPVGAGLLIQPTGMAVLDRLGLLESALTLGHQVERLDGRTINGRRVLDLSYADLQPGLFGLGLHRGALFSLLLDAATRESGVTIRSACAVVTLEQRTDRTVTVRCDNGTVHGPFDLVLVADGARSSLRAAAGLPVRIRTYAYAALWFVAAATDPRFDHTLSQVYSGTREMIGFLPSGRSAPGGPQTISIFWSLPRADYPAILRDGVDAWKRSALHLAPHAGGLIAQVHSREQLVFAEYHDVLMPRVHAGRIAFLGDAAHAMSPQLGQGANLALVDALCLADAVASHRSLDAALDAYADQRRAIVRFYARASRWLTPWFQSNLTALAWPRDLLGRSMGRVPWVRGQMLSSLAGVKDGLFSAQPLPSPLTSGSPPTPAASPAAAPAAPPPAPVH